MKTIKTILSLALVVLVLLAIFYNNGSVRLAKEIETSYDNDGKTIELEGRLNTPFLTRTGGGTTNMEFEVYNDFIIILNGNKKLTVTMNYGEGKNSILINGEGRKFESKDVIVFDKGGNKLTLSDKVKLTGLLKYTKKGEKNEISGKEDYTYNITNVVIEKI
ncbi:hypothetical protein [Pedobacter xixiisoli]|uniref:Uncharacterized protein n=1 Tax=Pedobacter xixiisoli TaxID=1476464 RepID=A0A285ZQ26_9SPHI|nr:hypothetical protein [Pedobacter xixiisoli]SOD11740.1 hypothetical protein SAMN06297358_0310 [Pedobacter xixiisoli]